MAPGAIQIIIIILLVMVLFGAGRIPTIMENLAKGVNSFKKGLKDEDASVPSVNESKSSEQDDSADKESSEKK